VSVCVCVCVSVCECVCDREASVMRRPWPTIVCRAMEEKNHKIGVLRNPVFFSVHVH
jgi:hypothetical protein